MTRPDFFNFKYLDFKPIVLKPPFESHYGSGVATSYLDKP